MGLAQELLFVGLMKYMTTGSREKVFALYGDRIDGDLRLLA